MGPANASLVHRTMGVVFAVIPLFYILTNWGSFARFIDTISSIGRDDIKWLTVMGGYLPFLKGKVPPQDKYNAGQKFLGWIIIVGCFLFIVTGFPMWLLRHSMPASLHSLCYTVHAWDALILGLAVLGHFFLAAIYPASRKEFSSMMTNGLVDAEYTSHHNGKWYRELTGDQSD
jgi:formate dehydrogenase subunit gamma